eukprot:scaffold127434_cov15-Tisochrysis_lutea.AAC.1
MQQVSVKSCVSTPDEGFVISGATFLKGCPCCKFHALIEGPIHDRENEQVTSLPPKCNISPSLTAATAGMLQTSAARQSEQVLNQRFYFLTVNNIVWVPQGIRSHTPPAQSSLPPEQKRAIEDIPGHTAMTKEEQERVLQEVEQAWLRARAQGKATTGLGAAD